MTITTEVTQRSVPECDGNSLQEAFLTAMLLTGSTSLAEAAVLTAIESGGGSADWGQPLLRRTVDASLRMPGPLRLMSANELETAGCAVPPALQTVLSLKRLARQCFVLRVLLSLPCWECALLLNVSEAEVASYSAAAASTLAFTHLVPTP